MLMSLHPPDDCFAPLTRQELVQGGVTNRFLSGPRQPAMVSRLLCGLLAGLCLLEFSEGARISNCLGNRKYVEGYDDPYLNCYVNSTSTVRWTVVKETGATLHLGTCYGPYNCTTPYNSSVLYIGQYTSLTQVQIINIASQFSGVLTCQETLTNGTVLTDTCPLNLARVSFGSTRHVDIRENATGLIYCYNYPFTPSSVTWSLTTTSGQTLALGTCTDGNTCTSPHASDITLTRPYNYRSQVRTKGIDRNKGGELFCSYTYKGLTETDNATLNMYSPATVSNCHAEVHHGNWSTILSCDVSNVFSGAGLYNFTVNEYFKFLRHGLQSSEHIYVVDSRLSYRDMLTPYTNSTDNKLYYRGRLTYSWPLLPTPGIYTRLRANVYYGISVYATSYVVNTVNITRPSQPTHNCSELNYIPETGVVPCVCTADYLGSPAGRLVWLLGNVTIATGDYGVAQLTFPSGSVSRQHDGVVVTCQLDWVQPINTTFTRHVASLPQSQTERDQFKWTAVGVGVALGIVVIALVVLVVVITVLCRRQDTSSRPNAPTPQDEEDSHCYTSLRVTQNKRNSAKQGVTCPSAVYQGDGDNDYENTGTGGQGGHM